MVAPLCVAPFAYMMVFEFVVTRTKPRRQPFGCIALCVVVFLLNVALLSFQVIRFQRSMPFYNESFSPSLHVEHTRHVKIGALPIAVSNPLSSLNSTPTLVDDWQKRPHVHHGSVDRCPKLHFRTFTHTDEKSTLADVLRKRIRILCIIQTRHSFHATRAVHVKATWANRCTHAFFISDAADPSLPAIDSGVGSENKEFTWGKVKAAFRYANTTLGLNNYDWFLKCDDDAFVVVENLRYMVANFSPNEPIWFGKQFKAWVEHTYMSGGPGYVLSREAVRRLVLYALVGNTTAYASVGRVTRAHDNKDYVRNYRRRHVFDGIAQRCRYDSDAGAEDVDIGLCLQSVGVRAVDSRDGEGRARFMALKFSGFLMPPDDNNKMAASSIINDPDFWYMRYSLHMEQFGMNCCSDYPIGFHYIDVQTMYMLEYLLYHARPFGTARHETLPSAFASSTNDSKVPEDQSQVKQHYGGAKRRKKPTATKRSKKMKLKPKSKNRKSVRN